MRVKNGRRNSKNYLNDFKRNRRDKTKSKTEPNSFLTSEFQHHNRTTSLWVDQNTKRFTSVLLIQLQQLGMKTNNTVEADLTSTRPYTLDSQSASPQSALKDDFIALWGGKLSHQTFYTENSVFLCA